MNGESAGAAAQGRRSEGGPAHGGVPAMAPGPARPVTRRFTRDDVLRLGRMGRAWEFMPVALAALRAAPADTAVRFLFSAALGKLGLRTLAIEQLRLVGGEAAADPAVGQLRIALEGLPPDEITAERRRDLVAGNLDALGNRGIDLARQAAAWGDKVGGEQAFRTTDGNVVRRRVGAMEPWAWTHLADHAGAAGAFVTQHLAKGPTPQPPVTIEGIDPPWLLQRLARAMPRDATGFQARLVVVQADAAEAIDGLSLADLREELRPERVMVFAGGGASERYAVWLRGNLSKRLSGPVVPLAAVRTRCEPPVAAVVQEAIREQERRSAELRNRVMERAAARGAGWIAGRMERACAAQNPPPLRVLIPTCRYTTFLQHAGKDLCEAFGQLGCRAQVLIEPDGHSQMSSVAYLEALDQVDPDLVVLINYTRAQLGDIMPAGVPVVTWVQDMMPHLFTKEAGAGQGPLDFVAGHCGEDLFSRYGYDRERAIGSPVVASETKFHPAPVDQALRDRFACEIACVTHHSETVEAMHERLVRESAADPDVAGMLAELLPACRDVAARAHGLCAWGALKDEVSRAMARRHRMAGNPDVEGAVLRNYAMPVADRAFRHLALQWAAHASGRRGWRLKIYGKGWQNHPTLSPFAAGLTEHGEELRAAYQCAAVNLHLCLSTLMHQRPMECALSGGLPVVRPTRDVLSSLRCRAQERLAASNPTPVGVDAEFGLPLYAFADVPEGMRLAALAQRLGMAERPGLLLTEQKLAAIRRRRAVEPIETDPAWLFGDLADVSFADEAGLERVVERAIERPEWREDVSRGIAGRVRERLTHAALARRIVEAVGRRAREMAGRASDVQGHA